MSNQLNSPTNFKYYKIVLHALFIITGADYRMPTCELLSKLGWSSLKEKKNKQKRHHDVQNYEWYEPSVLRRYLYEKYREIGLYTILGSQDVI